MHGWLFLPYCRSFTSLCMCIKPMPREPVVDHCAVDVYTMHTNCCEELFHTQEKASWHGTSRHTMAELR